MLQSRSYACLNKTPAFFFFFQGKSGCTPLLLLDRVAFWIVYIAWRVGYKIVACKATSVGVGRRNTLFWVAETVLLFLLLSILLCILLWWCFRNRQVNRVNKCKHEISDSLHYSIFFIPFCYAVLHTDPHVNKDFFLFEFFSKDSLSCCKVGATHA